MAGNFVSRGFLGRRRQDPEVAARIPPGQYLESGFPVLSAGPTPHTPLNQWSFTVRGAAQPSQTWSWDEFRAKHDELVARDAWVLDGNYSSGGLEQRLARADTVYVLIVPRVVALARVTRRWLRHRGGTRPDLGEGRPEKLDADFIRWIWNWPRNHRDLVDEVRRQARGTVVVRTRYRGKRRFIR